MFGIPGLALHPPAMPSNVNLSDINWDTVVPFRDLGDYMSDLGSIKWTKSSVPVGAALTAANKLGDGFYWKQTQAYLSATGRVNRELVRISFHKILVVLHTDILQVMNKKNQLQFYSVVLQLRSGFPSPVGELSMSMGDEGVAEHNPDAFEPYSIHKDAK